MPLAPDNQAEGQHIVEEPHDEEGLPDSRITRRAFAAPARHQPAEGGILGVGGRNVVCDGRLLAVFFGTDPLGL